MAKLSRTSKQRGRKAAEHENLADYFAQESHKFDAPLSDALSGLSEAHREYARALQATVTDQHAEPKGARGA